MHVVEKAISRFNSILVYCSINEDVQPEVVYDVI